MIAEAMVRGLSTGAPSTIGAQTEPRVEDVSTIDGIIRAYYEVVSGPVGGFDDDDRDRTLHHPDAQITLVSRDESGNVVVAVMTLAELHGEREARAEDFWEWEISRRVERHGNMVHVWSSYASGPVTGETPTSGGVSSVTLLWDGDRWWIMNWMSDDPG